jgi:hypothetical protein
VSYEKIGEYDLALSQYQNIITHHNDGIYSDEALFFCRRFIITNYKIHRKQKPMRKLFLIMKTVYTLLKLEKKFKGQIRGDTNL